MCRRWTRAALLPALIGGFGWVPGVARAQQWAQVPLPPQAGQLSAPRGSAGGLYAIIKGADWSPQGLWKRSWDSGAWQLEGFAANDPRAVEVSGFDHRCIFLCCHTGDQRFFVSHDDGETWTGKAGPPESIEGMGVDRQRPSVIYGARQTLKMYASTDEGDSWTLWDGGSGGGTYWTDATPAPLSASNGYAAHTGSFGDMVLFRTTNGGTSWEGDESFPSDPSDGLGRLAVTPMQPSAVFVLPQYRLIEDLRGGWTAHDLPVGFHAGTITIPHWAPGTIYVAGGREQGSARVPAAYKTEDFGETWVDISDGLPQVDLGGDWWWTSLDWHPTDGRLVLSYGYPPMLFLRQEEVSAGLGNSGVDRRAGIELAPSPTAGPVTIRLRVGHGEDRTTGARPSIEILDVLGRRIRTAPGRNDVSDPTLLGVWNGETDAGTPAGPGVYFVRVSGIGSTRVLVVR